MNRTTIVLPSDVKAEAMRRARARGISFGELVREALARLLRESGEDANRRARRQAVEAMLRFARHAPVGPRDLSANLDHYLYNGKKTPVHLWRSSTQAISTKQEPGAVG